MNRTTRRKLLAAGGLSLGALVSGCLGDGGDGGTATTTETTTTEPTTETTTTATKTDTTTTTRQTTTSTIPEGDHRVEMTDDLSYEPDRLQVDPGDSVVWVNVGSLSHTVTAYDDELPDGAAYFASGGFDSSTEARDAYPDGDVAPDTAFVHTFETEGVYEYFCVPHESAGMTGSVRVGDDSTQTTTTTESGSTTIELTDALEFSPGEVEIAAGTTVEWFNVGSLRHTVTAYEDELPTGAEYFASGGFDGEEAARAAYPEGSVQGCGTYTHTFETTGTYEYFCLPHEGAGMTGTIHVV